MKQFLLLISLLFSTIGLQAQSQIWGLVTDNGTEVPLSQVDFLLAADNDTEFSIVLKEGEAIAHVQKADVKMITETSIRQETLTEANPTLLMVDETLTLMGADKHADISVYALDGSVQNVQVSREESVKVDVSGLSQGAYVLKVGRSAVKFQKK
ncbi:MAG: T9SS type A sorting domain-containing protein [Prevotella sp.]|nr:T9SS type A sorting domain-containing protein [Prevotella sp.]